MINITIAIIDDKKQERNKLLEYVETFISSSPISFKIAQYENGEKFVEEANIPSISIAFIDIVMKDLTGIDVAKKIRETNKNCFIIFISSTNHYASESYQVNALEYLAKPYSYDDIDRIMKKIIKSQELSSMYIEVIENRERVQVKISNILYVDYYQHSVLLNTLNRTIKTYSVKFSDVEERLLLYRNFISIRKNLVVNMDKVLQIKDKQFVMCNDMELPISRNIFSDVKIKYTDYIFNKLREEMR